MNKFNIGDKVQIIKRSCRYIDVDSKPYESYVIKELNGRGGYTLESPDGMMWYEMEETALELIEQDTKEHTPTDEEIETDTSYEDTPKQKESLDYEKEYKLLLKEYEDLNEELYIAKTAIKMLSELI